MPIISAVGLFCCDKFEETPNEKVVNMSKLTKSYFNAYLRRCGFGRLGRFLIELHSIRAIVFDIFTFHKIFTFDKRSSGAFKFQGTGA